jgi:hypothetical protein
MKLILKYKIKSVLKLVFLCVLVQFFFSCTSYFVRKECESLNWYQTGFDIALRGDRISNDNKVNQCRKVEAEISESQLDNGFKAGMSRYCQPDTVYQTGKSGETVNTEFCDSSNMGLLQKRHADGNKAYCSDGYTAGVSGKKYKNVCSEELEKTFMPAYRTGRKKFLDGKIQVADAKKRDLILDIDKLTYEKRVIDSRRNLLPLMAAGQPDPYVNERQSLDSRLRGVESELNSKEYQRRTLDKEIGEYQAEALTLQ